MGSSLPSSTTTHYSIPRMQKYAKITLDIQLVALFFLCTRSLSWIWQAGWVSLKPSVWCLVILVEHSLRDALHAGDYITTVGAGRGASNHCLCTSHFPGAGIVTTILFIFGTGTFIRGTW